MTGRRLRPCVDYNDWAVAGVPSLGFKPRLLARERGRLGREVGEGRDYRAAAAHTIFYLAGTC